MDIKEEARVRAERARKYAAMFPHLIRPSDRVFQDEAWQLEQLTKYQKKANKGAETANKEAPVSKPVNKEEQRKVYMKDYMKKRREQAKDVPRSSEQS